MTFRNWLSAAIFAGAALAMGQAAEAQKAGGTLVFIAQPEPPSLASYLSTSGPIGLVAPKIYEGLLDFDKDLNPVPSLAESYEVSEDGMTVTFNLQQGVTWHDGQPFTSADVAVHRDGGSLSKVHPRGPNSFKEVDRNRDPRRAHRHLQARQPSALHDACPLRLMNRRWCQSTSLKVRTCAMPISLTTR